MITSTENCENFNEKANWNFISAFSDTLVMARVNASDNVFMNNGQSPKQNFADLSRQRWS